RTVRGGTGRVPTSPRARRPSPSTNDTYGRSRYSAAPCRGGEAMPRAVNHSWLSLRAGRCLRHFIIRTRLVDFISLVRAHGDIAEESRHHGEQHGGEGQRLRRALPEPDGVTDVRVGGETVIEIWLIGVMQHVHHVCPADTLRIVQARVLKAP